MNLLLVIDLQNEFINDEINPAEIKEYLKTK